jgi:hypothetical protein
MTDERDVMQGMARAWNEGRFDAWAECFSQGCVMHTDPEWPEAGAVEGRPAIERFARDFADQWDVSTLEVGEIEQRGEAWLVETRWVLKGRSSGAETDLPFVSVVRFEDDRISELRLLRDRDQAIAAAEG